MHSPFYLSFVLVLSFLAGCSGKILKPCTEGGQPPHAAADIPFRGTKRCLQVQDKEGITVNHGKYYEWHLNDRLATEGEYKMGKKTGRWIEYNEQGTKVTDLYFENGKEIPRP